MNAPRAVVVGTGFGLRVHVPALRAGGFDVAALVGQDAERTARRAQRLGIDAAFGSLAEALAQVDAQVVTIATPPHTHAPLALEAIAAGKHVISEKPMALSVAQGEEMADAAARAGVFALLGSEFRWDPSVEAIRGAIARGDIGTPHTATITRYYPILAGADAPAPDWWFDEQRGGGWLRANGTHLIDQIQLWLGTIVEVDAEIRQTVARSSGRADDTYSVRFLTERGVSGILQECASAWGENYAHTRIAGTDGTVVLDADGCRVLTGQDVRPLLESAGAASVERHENDPRPWTSEEIASYSQLARWLHDALAGTSGNSAFPAPATFADGLAVQRVVDAMTQSAAERRTVAVQHHGTGPVQPAARPVASPLEESLS